MPCGRNCAGSGSTPSAAAESSSLRSGCRCWSTINPLSYELDLLRQVVLGYRQLPMPTDLAVTRFLSATAGVLAAEAMAGIRGRRAVWEFARARSGVENEGVLQLKYEWHHNTTWPCGWRVEDVEQVSHLPDFGRGVIAFSLSCRLRIGGW